MPKQVSRKVLDLQSIATRFVDTLTPIRSYLHCLSRSFRAQATAESAIRNLNGVEFAGRQLRVDSATNKGDMQSDNGPGGSHDRPHGGQSHSGPAPMRHAPPVGPLQNVPPPEYGAPAPTGQVQRAVDDTIESLDPQKLYGVMKQFKTLIATQPEQARAVLLSQPQLSYALLQAQVRMNMIDEASAQAMIERARSMPQGRPGPRGPEGPMGGPGMAVDHGMGGGRPGMGQGMPGPRGPGMPQQRPQGPGGRPGMPPQGMGRGGIGPGGFQGHGPRGAPGQFGPGAGHGPGHGPRPGVGGPGPGMARMGQNMGPRGGSGQFGPTGGAAWSGGAGGGAVGGGAPPNSASGPAGLGGGQPLTAEVTRALLELSEDRIAQLEPGTQAKIRALQQAAAQRKGQQ